MQHHYLPAGLGLLMATSLLAGCSSAPSEPAPSPSDNPSTSASAASCATLDPSLEWYGDNRERIDAMLASVGTCGAEGDVAKGAPVALFDWDNTVVKNDIGDAQTYWMLANGKVLRPTAWTEISPFFTEEATAALSAACDSLAEPGKPLPTNTEAGAACADEILAIYGDAETTTGKAAFRDFNARRVEPQYAFAAQLLAGYTPDQITDFATQAREQNITAPEGTKQTIGTTEVTGWVRYYDQMTNLIEVLRANGFDVRIVSASAEPVVRAWGRPIGFTDDKLMGVRTEVADGLMTPNLISCGGEANSMTYIEGKRCRVNEDVFGLTGAQAWEVAPLDKRAAFGAGDSDTDVSFLIDATELRLVLNRNKTELMCEAYDNEDGNWIINPMFIDPKGKMEGLYPCSTKAAILPDDSKGPLNDINGNLIEDQEDTVYQS